MARLLATSRPPSWLCESAGSCSRATVTPSARSNSGASGARSPAATRSLAASAAGSGSGRRSILFLPLPLALLGIKRRSICRSPTTSRAAWIGTAPEHGQGFDEQAEVRAGGVTGTHHHAHLIITQNGVEARGITVGQCRQANTPCRLIADRGSWFATRFNAAANALHIRVTEAGLSPRASSLSRQCRNSRITRSPTGRASSAGDKRSRTRRGGATRPPRVLRSSHTRRALPQR